MPNGLWPVFHATLSSDKIVSIHAIWMNLWPLNVLKRGELSALWFHKFVYTKVWCLHNP
uniref:Uncharacterized protein n=1 Tax=Rhizophora mucronata TaxID=61149 RepID=A0A2P2Q5J4_RHIMU